MFERDTFDWWVDMHIFMLEKIILISLLKFFLPGYWFMQLILSSLTLLSMHLVLIYT